MTNVFLSGRFTLNAEIEKAWLKRSGCKFRCFSFAFLNPAKTIPGYYSKQVVEALKVNEDAKTSIMMDSGAFSLHVFARASSKRSAKAKSKQQKDPQVLQVEMYKAYTEYCKAGKDKWAFYVTLDFKQDQPIIYAMQQKFHADGLSPMPVYHGDSSLDWLSKHKDMGHTYIGIGGGMLHPGKGGLDFYFDKVFNYGAKHGLEFHGLAMTAFRLIVAYPFKSVDSSTWSRSAAFGMIQIPDLRRRKFLNVHVSNRTSSNQHSLKDMSKIQKEQLSSLLATHGFDLKAMHESEAERHDWNGFVMSNLDKFGVVAGTKKLWEPLL